MRRGFGEKKLAGNRRFLFGAPARKFIGDYGFEAGAALDTEAGAISERFVVGVAVAAGTFAWGTGAGAGMAG